MPKKEDSQAKGSKRKREEPEAETTASTKKACKVYLQGVPRLCQAASIKERFAKYGSVLDVEIPTIRRNKTKRIAFVTFAKKSEAKAALEEDEAEFEGSTLKVQLSGAPKEVASKSAPEEATATSTKVFVAGFGSRTADEVSAYFSKKCGSVQSLTMPESAKTKGRSRGFVILEFAKKAHAAAAVELNETQWKGQKLAVQWYTSSAADEKVKKKAAAKKSAREKREQAKHEFRVFIQGFPKGISEKSLKEHFEPCGEIRQVTMPKKKDGALRGVAFVSFASKEAMKEALRLDGQEFRDKPLKVVKSNKSQQDADE
eukprot:s689_g16.t1